MKINFNEIRKQKLDVETLINIIEAIYNSMNENNFNNIKMNELSIAENINVNEFSVELKFRPISINDILIISRKEQYIISPDSITEIKDKEILIKDARLKNKDELFVTYKY